VTGITFLVGGTPDKRRLTSRKIYRPPGIRPQAGGRVGPVSTRNNHLEIPSTSIEFPRRADRARIDSARSPDFPKIKGSSRPRDVALCHLDCRRDCQHPGPRAWWITKADPSCCQPPFAPTCAAFMNEMRCAGWRVRQGIHDFAQIGRSGACDIAPVRPRRATTASACASGPFRPPSDPDRAACLCASCAKMSSPGQTKVEIVVRSSRVRSSLSSSKRDRRSARASRCWLTCGLPTPSAADRGLDDPPARGLFFQLPKPLRAINCRHPAGPRHHVSRPAAPNRNQPALRAGRGRPVSPSSSGCQSCLSCAW